ncbi:hypothetical protein C1Y40_04013 [Mycobacterium talmoniae]|uniref:Uncharacterized protein n=1 Tax=Mycobacterium talmoniae TaxID=1858794 RepID=A0A2S8BGK7_9MYCO|nr:hypothetical protein C1Y40_04013 [Mycobacterium talmoniae]
MRRDCAEGCDFAGEIHDPGRNLTGKSVSTDSGYCTAQRLSATHGEACAVTAQACAAGMSTTW